MKDFLYDLYIEPFTYRELMGHVLGVFFWLTTIFVIVLISIGIYYIVDTTDVTLNQTTVCITDKRYEPAYTTTTAISNGKIVIPVTNHHPESWIVDVEAKEGVDSVSTGNKFYSESSVGMCFLASYKSGRLSGGFYVKEIISQDE
jgi:ABC-type sulfate transport system permease component